MDPGCLWVAFGSFIQLSGRLGDSYGRKKMMVILLLLFATGSIITGSSNWAMLTICSRFIGGMGGINYDVHGLVTLCLWISPSIRLTLSWTFCAVLSVFASGTCAKQVLLCLAIAIILFIGFDLVGRRAV